MSIIESNNWAKAKEEINTNAFPAEDGAALNTALNEHISNHIKLETGSYVGAGTYGMDNPNTLTFNFVPKVLIVTSNQTDTLGGGLLFIRDTTNYAGFGTFYRNSSGFSLNISSGHCTINWGDNSVSWYSDKNANFQNNSTSITYYYVAIG